MKVDLGTRIALAPEDVWHSVQRPELLRHIAWPLMRFSPVDRTGWPDRFENGKAVYVRLWLFGVLPLGAQWIVPSLSAPSTGGWPRMLRDDGRSRLIRRWDHRISVEPDDAGYSRYRDQVEIDADVLTPLVGAFANLFYRHRQRRWRGLAGRLHIFQLIWDEQARSRVALARGDMRDAWDALETVHIAGQPYLGAHWSSHIAMLRLAIWQRDWRETAGQLLRLALVPIGNATGRLPVGNHGRSRVSPFRPMPITEDLRRRLAAGSKRLSPSSNRDSC